MMRMARRWLSVLVVLAACGGDDKKDDGPDDGDNTGGANTSGTNDTGGADAGNNSGSTGDHTPVTDAANCDDDDPATPGADCKGVVACGGKPDALHACPLATHSCCTSGFPMEDTVNCFEGTSSCTADETVTPCDGPEECADGQVCCVTVGASASTKCVASTDCVDGAFVFCHTDDDCAAGQSCKASNSSPFWGFCG